MHSDFTRGVVLCDVVGILQSVVIPARAALSVLSDEANVARAEHDAEGGGAKAAGEESCDGGGDVPPAAPLQ